MKRMLLILLACGAVSGAVLADGTVEGTVDPNDNATAIALTIGAGWQQGGGACRVLPGPAKAGEGLAASAAILQVDQPCSQAFAKSTPVRRIDYLITVPDGVLIAPYDYFLEVVCDAGSGALGTSVGFAAVGTLPLPDDCPPGAACNFDYGAITVSTVESGVTFGSRIDALETTGVIALVAGLLGVGFFLIIRRGFAV